MTTDTKRASLRDPEQEFTAPSEVAEHPELSIQDKLAILRNWRLDLIELQTATNENMVDANADPGAVAERLRQVSEAIERLEPADSRH